MNISYVIPCYNCEKWLAEAVRSIMETNFEPGDELIMVDDGSTDDTGVISGNLLTKYGYEKNQVTHVHRVKNAGCGESRNVGNEVAIHDWIYAHDADNVLQPHSVAALRKRAEKGDVDAVSPGAIWFFRGSVGNRVGAWEFKSHVPLEDFLSCHDLPTSSGNYLYKRSLWQAVPHAEGVGALEAWTWGLRILMHGAKFATVPGTTYWHRQGIDSLWIRDNKTVDFNVVARKQMEPYLDRLDEPSKLRVSSPNWYTDLSRYPLKLESFVPSQRLGICEK
jgi:glycosyltransferase involved in cell wall biosynthesis